MWEDARLLLPRRVWVQDERKDKVKANICFPWEPSFQHHRWMLRAVFRELFSVFRARTQADDRCNWRCSTPKKIIAINLWFKWQTCAEVVIWMVWNLKDVKDNNRTRLVWGPRKLDQHKNNELIPYTNNDFNDCLIALLNNRKAFFLLRELIGKKITKCTHEDAEMLVQYFNGLKTIFSVYGVMCLFQTLMLTIGLMLNNWEMFSWMGCKHLFQAL